MRVQERPRSREIEVKIGVLEPGPRNAITDVEEVKVGHVTLIEGEGPLKPGIGPVRTGVTVVLPHGRNLFKKKVKGAVHIINAFGKSIGLPQVMELGTIETPIALTNTLNVGIVADALIEYMLETNEDIGVTTGSVNPVVGECNDGYLNDIRGRHVGHRHVYKAIRDAQGGDVEEGVVGAGTGMTAFGFKGGIGTASRRIQLDGRSLTVGALVLSNFGKREDLLINGVPVGRELTSIHPRVRNPDGSVMVILATDAPLSTHQLTRLSRRATLGLARTGSMGSHGSGDFVIAFSTANPQPHYPEETVRREEKVVEHDQLLDHLFRATVEATEEAVINSILKAPTVIGRDGNTSLGIPIEDVIEVMERYGRRL